MLCWGRRRVEQTNSYVMEKFGTLDSSSEKTYRYPLGGRWGPQAGPKQEGDQTSKTRVVM